MVRITYYVGTVSIAGLIAVVLGKVCHLSYTGTACLAVGLSFYLLWTNPAPADPPNQPLSATLESIRIKYKLPALGGALFTTDGLIEFAAVGVRKSGNATPATKDDLWHLGSDTKAMTATLAGSFVAEKKLSWDDKVLTYFPDIAGTVTPAMRDVTIAQVLRHRAGFADHLVWTHAPNDTLPAQRQSMSRLALTKPQWPPGAYHYSNFDYVLVAAILEQISGKPWEELIRERLFDPLGMTSAGFGGLGTPGLIDQPWPHDDTGTPVSINGPAIDNPPVIAPDGTVHCTMTDWSKFLID